MVAWPAPVLRSVRPRRLPMGAGNSSRTMSCRVSVVSMNDSSFSGRCFHIFPGCESSMCRAAGLADLETPNQKGQGQAQNYDKGQQVKTIHESQHRGLLSHHICSHSIRLMERIRTAASACHQVMARSAQELADRCVGGSQVGDQYALMVLCAPLKHRGDESDTEAAAPVAAQIGEA